MYTLGYGIISKHDKDFIVYIVSGFYNINKFIVLFSKYEIK